MSSSHNNNNNNEETVENWEDLQEDEVSTRTRGGTLELTPTPFPFQLTNKMRLLKTQTLNQVTATNPVSPPSSGIRIQMRPTEAVGGAVAPPPPKFKILKRPTPGAASLVNPVPSPFDDDTSAGTGASDVQSPRDPNAAAATTAVKRAPVKSLEQRKQEYAEARLRILGDAKYSDDDDEEDKARTGNPNAPQQQQQNSGNNRNNTGGGARNNFNSRAGGGGGQQMPMHSRPPPMFNASIPPPPFDPVIRVPRGPDGTTGFQGRR